MRWIPPGSTARSWYAAAIEIITYLGQFQTRMSSRNDPQQNVVWATSRPATPNAALRDATG